MNKQQQNTNMSQPIVIYLKLLMYIYLKALLCGTGQVTGQCISIHITTGLTLEIILYNSILLGKDSLILQYPMFTPQQCSIVFFS